MKKSSTKESVSAILVGDLLMQHVKAEKLLTCIAFAGGGSGGHSYPLLAVAAELERLHPQVRTYFVSTPNSVEPRILAKANREFFLIPSGKLNGQKPHTILLTLLKLPFAFWKSIWILLQNRPQVVVSAGGYAGAPFLVAAALLGVPCAVYEQNRKPGLANTWMAKFASLVLINFPETATYFPRQVSVAVGLPFRKEILKARWEKSEWADRLQSNPFRIFVFGGSQGALAINRLVVQSLKFLDDLAPQIFIHHQTGQNDLATVEQGYQAAKFTNCQIEPYIYDMTSAYKAAHLVICRAGASSLVELAAAGKAAILIPLVSKDNHQEPNAQDLAQRGAAVVLRQREANGEVLARQIRDFFEHREHIQKIAEKISSGYVTDAETRIIQELRNLIEA